MTQYLGGEQSAVQKKLIEYVSEAFGEYTTSDGEKKVAHCGWEYVGPDEALQLRGGKTGLLFKGLFVGQMQKLNPSFMNQQMAEDLVRRVERIPPNIKGNLESWEYLKGLRTIFVPDEKQERNVAFVDTRNIENNTFHVTDEFEFTNGSKTIRLDVVFLLNGVPIFFVETKAAHKIEGISEALDQIRRYHLECPELLAVPQVYALTHLIKYYYSATWNTSGKGLFDWKEETKGDFETIVKTFLDRARIIKLITDFILFTRQDDELKKVVLRPHQMRAVDRLVERAEDTEKKRGLIWHTQGSGKTYTMIVTAKKIMENPVLENPTVIMLVDRNELETQLFGHLEAVGIERLKVAESKNELKKLLAEDRRGLIVSMIHKFEDIPENISTRDNIFVLVDEAHRTTGGKLGNYLMGALPNANYIGFTGTPIDKTAYGRGTFITFGKDDPPKGYLDKYSISESIADKTTVPLHYTLAPNDLQVDKETLEKEFLDLKEAEGLSDIEELNKVLQRAVNLRNMLKNPERRKKVAKYMAEHFKKYIEPMGYKAFLVAVDREACALYKKELDKHLPKEYSEVVYSAGFNDVPELAQYHLSEDKEKQTRKAFRKPNELPKILIVTEKLLTGFDAPILYCMYLDKPMRDHVLLQAIARVNRPYEDDEGRRKPSGFVLDFVGIFDNLEKALAFDSSDIEGVVRDIEVLKKRFAQLMQDASAQYLVLIKEKTRDKAVEAVLEHFKVEHIRHEYYRFFKELSDIYEIISPDAFLRPYVEDYETLARMFRIAREAFEPGPPVDKEFLRKTAKLVQKHAQSGEIEGSLEVYEINEETIDIIEKRHISDTEKVFNLIKSIVKTVQENAGKSPYLISIGEKAEIIAQSFIDRQKHSEEVLEELKGLIAEINQAREEQAEKNMPVEVFSVYYLMRKEGIENPEQKANEMRDVFEKYPHWRSSEHHEREVRQNLYKVLLSSGTDNVQRVTEQAQKLLRIVKGDVG